MANSAIESLNRVKFAGLDFDTHEDDLRARLQTNFASDYNDFTTSAQGIMLLDIVSFGLDTLSFYLDRRATDTFLATARTRKAVSRLTRQVGYKMGGAVSAACDLQVAVTTPKAFTVPIPQGFQFQGPNGLVFEAAKAVDFAPVEQGAALPKNIPVFEGSTTTETFVSDGTANQIFQLKRVGDGKFVAQGSVQVLVDGAAWEESDFIEFEETDQFEIGYNDSPPTVRFGDSVAGNIPVRGASIVVTYVATSGLAGKVNANTIQASVTPLVVSAQTITLSINNPSGSTGGDDAEDIERAKSFAGRVFKSRQVAVTRKDYEALAGSYADPLFGRVAVAQAISARSAENDLELKNLLLIISGMLAPQVSILRGLITSQAGTQGTIGSVSVLDKITNFLADISTRETAIATATVDIDTRADAVISGIRGNKNKANDSIAQATAGKAAIDAIGTAGSDQLTLATKNALKAYYDNMITNDSTIATTAQTQIDQLGIVRDDAAAIGLDIVTAGSALQKIETDRAGISALVGTSPPLPTAATGLYAVFYTTLEGVADQLDPALPGAAALTISDSLMKIEQHVDKILAADCKSNLVVVPILARDAAGFYSAPSNALVQSLQDYLDARKEVTQTVAVTNGGNFLVKAVLTIRVGVLQGYSTSQTATAISAVADGLLRSRKFGESLYVSEVTDAILNVPGVEFTNVKINGYKTELGGSSVFVDLLDLDGNLVIPSSQVITKGDVTVLTPEIVPSST
jgi:copper chaperone CopZ